MIPYKRGYLTVNSSSPKLISVNGDLSSKSDWKTRVVFGNKHPPQHSGLFVMVAENCFLEAKSSQEASMFGLERGCEA
jgi:hypothetical protein